MKNKIEKDSFITEIEEDLKNDNLKKLWDKYGAYLIATMALILLSTIAIEVYGYFKVKANQKMVDKYAYALNFEELKQTQKANEAFLELTKEGGFVKDLAMLQNVDLLIEEGKTDAAYDALDAIVKSKDVSFQIKDVAIMMQASIAVDTKSVDDVAMIISPLLDMNNAWMYNAIELLAVAQLKAGNKEEAIDLFDRIATESMNEGIKNRAMDVLSVLR